MQDIHQPIPISIAILQTIYEQWKKKKQQALLIYNKSYMFYRQQSGLHTPLNENTSSLALPLLLKIFTPSRKQGLI